MRAIRGVFTNAPPGSFVRHGAAHLTVDIDFGDGNTVTWEKGWKKPGRKGGTVNRYVVNGHEMSDVGRGVPAEVEALGINLIQAGTERLWPQVADQFRGVLFLVDSPGSVVAEAVADVDRVGKLAAALKLSEKDGRTATSTLRIRRKDVETFTEELEDFRGLETVTGKAETLDENLSLAERTLTKVTTLRDVSLRLGGARREVQRFQGVSTLSVPDGTGAQDAGDEWKDARALRARRVVALREVRFLEGIGDVPVPSRETAQEAPRLRDQIRNHRQLQRRLESGRTLVASLEGVEGVALVNPDLRGRLPKTKDAVGFFRGLRDRHAAATKAVSTLEQGLEKATREVELLKAQADDLLSELGVCPTCRRPVEASP
jgi:hypothetical protein